MKVIFDKYVDRDNVAAAIALGSFEVAVVNAFTDEVGENFTVDVADFDSTNKEAFYKTIDQMTFPIAENAVIWKIEKTSKTFNLENSYVRSELTSGKGSSDIDDGVPLKVRFDIPGFVTSNFREIDLWYNTDFNPTDIDLLAEIGIDLTGNGSEFTIDNAVECKVSFSKPTSGVSEVYIIDYPNNNEIIES